MNLLIQLFRNWAYVVATFRQSLSPIVSKLSTRDKSRNLGKLGLLVKHIQELAKTSHEYAGSSALRWWAGAGNNRSIADRISGYRKPINIGQKLAEKQPLGLQYTQLIHSYTTVRCQNIT